MHVLRFEAFHTKIPERIPQLSNMAPHSHPTERPLPREFSWNLYVERVLTHWGMQEARTEPGGRLPEDT